MGPLELTITDIGILTAVAAAILGATIGTARKHINSEVNRRVNGRVDVAVGQAMTLVNTKLDTIALNQRENSAALGRIHDLEVVINNGVHEDVKDLKHEIGEIKDHLLGWKCEARHDN